MQRLKGNALPSCRAEGGASHGALGQRRPLIRPDGFEGGGQSAEAGVRKALPQNG
jgi:hypothetical protein